MVKYIYIPGVEGTSSNIVVNKKIKIRNRKYFLTHTSHHHHRLGDYITSPLHERKEREKEECAFPASKNYIRVGK